jgi:hypothetical protein
VAVTTLANYDIEWSGFSEMFGRWTLLALVACIAAHAQDTRILPEIDGYLKVNPHFRTYLQAKDDRDGGDPQQFAFGPSLQFYFKPLLKLKRVSLFDLNDAQKRPLVIETGYRVVTAPGTPNVNRAIEAVTFHLPFVSKTLFSDRNRADLDWQTGTFTWRYRNKLTLQRTVRISSYHVIPYGAAEVFYESQYRKWSSTDLYAGCLFPVGKHVQFDAYYEHENNTGKSPNRQDNFIGIALYLYFSFDGAGD